MTSAFCPGHVSCIFQPITSFDVLGTGSRGVGIRLSLGAKATVEPRDDSMVNIWLDGVQSIAHITRMAAEKLAPGTGFDIRIDNDLPVSQGFGMSAAGALAASVCIAHIVGRPRASAFIAAHVAEVEGGGGLGDVAAIVGGKDIPIRTVPGIPPHGKIINAKFRFPELTLAVIGNLMETDSILGNGMRMEDIRSASSAAMDSFLESPTADRLFEASNSFSSGSFLESPAMRRAIEGLNNKGYRAGMCMLGNSIFTDAPEEEVWKLLGRGHVRTYRCSSSSKEIILTHKE